MSLNDFYRLPVFYSKHFFIIHATVTLYCVKIRNVNIFYLLTYPSVLVLLNRRSKSTNLYITFFVQLTKHETRVKQEHLFLTSGNIPRTTLCWFSYLFVIIAFYFKLVLDGFSLRSKFIKFLIKDTLYP